MTSHPSALRRSPIAAIGVPSAMREVLVDGDLRDERQIAPDGEAHALDRELDLLGLAHRLEEERVDAALGERLGLLAERARTRSRSSSEKPAKTSPSARSRPAT